MVSEPATGQVSSAAAVGSDHQTSTAETLDAAADDHGYTKRARVSCSRATTSAMQLLLGDDYTENSSSLALQSELETISENSAYRLIVIRCHGGKRTDIVILEYQFLLNSTCAYRPHRFLQRGCFLQPGLS